VNLCVRVDSVHEEGEGEITAAAAEMVNLQPFDLLQQVGFSGQQSRHGDERPKRLRNARLELEARQRRCVEAPRHHAIDECRRSVCRRDERDQCEKRKPTDIEAWNRERSQRESQQNSGGRQDRAGIAADTEADAKAGNPESQRRPESDHPFECRPALGYQVIAGVGSALHVGCTARSGCRCT
jgi:hypothetical protein